MHKVKISYLSEFIEKIPQLSELYYNEWSDKYVDINQVKENLNKRLSEKNLPISLVALMEDKVVGAICLKDFEIDYKNKTPWLASLIVDKNYRKMGIAKLLIEEIIRITKELNYREIYLYTDTASDYYKKLNWNYIENIDYNGKNISIFKKDL